MEPYPIRKISIEHPYQGSTIASTGANQFRGSLCLPLAAVSFANVFGLAASARWSWTALLPSDALQKDRRMSPIL